MAEIHVLFPPSGDPVTMAETAPVLKDEHIFWCIHNQNAAVKRIEIAFDEGASFFPTSSGMKSSMTKDLSSRQFIWGKSPHAPGTGQKRDKYTVRGLDAQNRMVVEHDPTIISDDP
jgi:hypothetical protein